MKKTVFNYLLWSNPKSIGSSYEQSFYDKNASLFIAPLLKYNDNTNIFSIIRANIILGGLLNKRKMDSKIKLFSADNLKSDIISDSIRRGLPYSKYRDVDIYIPSYPININRRYATNMSSFKSYPYDCLLLDKPTSIVDPFEEYGNSLFASPFTRLILLDCSEEDNIALYHPHFETIFVVSNQGFLTQEIPIFDDGCPKDKSNLFDRLNSLMNDYFTFDMEKFVDDLYGYHLISKSLYDSLKSIEDKRRNKREKRYR